MTRFALVKKLAIAHRHQYPFDMAALGAFQIAFTLHHKHSLERVSFSSDGEHLFHRRNRRQSAFP